MRLVHTADWHLGLLFHGYSRLAEQACFLHWLADTLVAIQADALLVAGDVFNILSPPIAAQKIFYDFLVTISERLPSLQIVITAGNHDSGARLEAPSGAFAKLKIYIKGCTLRQKDYSFSYDQFAVPLYDKTGNEFLCLAIPFLRLSDCPTTNSNEPPEIAFYRELEAYFANDPRPKICMGHFYATGSLLSNERDVEQFEIGGTAPISLSQYFSAYRYIALGHIHLQQHIANTQAYYPGAPIATTFAQSDRKHGVLMVDLTTSTTITALEYASPLQLIKLFGTPEEIKEQILALPLGEVDDLAPILSLEILVNSPIPTLKNEIETLLLGRRARLGPLIAKNTTTTLGREQDLLTVDIQSLTPEHIASLEYERRYDQPLPDPLRTILLQAIQSTKEQCEF